MPPSPESKRSAGDRSARRIRSTWGRQVLLLLAAYVTYDLARWAFAGDPATAVRHAHWILGLERTMGVAIEASVQRALDFGVPIWLLSNVYLAAQLVVPPAAFVWLYRRSPTTYRSLCDTVLATWLVAIPVYALFPVAPPRLAEPGVVDTVSDQAGVALTGHSTIFYNPLAAVPSLHVGFAVAIGVALFVALRWRWAKCLALLWGPTVAVAVVATGNHYLFDIAAGLLVVGGLRGGPADRPATGSLRRGRRSHSFACPEPAGVKP